MRYLLRLTYNGTDFHGWQIQPNAVTVQGVIEEKLSMLLQEKIGVLGCGRTDTGVHAKDFYAHFETQNPVADCKALCFRLNNVLPSSIVIHDLYPVSADFHARFSATARTYKYYIARKNNPFNQHVWLLFKDLDVEAMRDAGDLLIGEQDFTSFAKLHADVNNHICDLSFFQIDQDAEGDVEITITANRFLRNMVRAIVGSLVNVGLGKSSAEDFKNIIHSKNRSNAGASAPAKGLFLYDVQYPLELLAINE